MCTPSCLACCACSSLCGACTSCSCKDAGRASKVVYMMYLTVSLVVAVIMKIHGNEAVLDLPGFKAGCVDGSVENPTGSGPTSLACAGNQVVYRFSFGLVLFFAIMIVGSTVSRAWHVGLWSIKTILWIVITAGVFFIPNDFYFVYAEIARVISILFLIMQVVILFTFAFELHTWLLEKAIEADREAGIPAGQEPICSNCWRLTYLVLGFGSFAAALIGVGFLFDQFSCGIGYAFCSLTIIIILLILAITLSSPHSKGVIPGGVIAIYVTYLCFASLSSLPKPQCNPTLGTSGLGAILVGVIVSAISLSYTSWSAARSVAHMFTSPDDEEKEESGQSQQSSHATALVSDSRIGNEDALAEEGAVQQTRGASESRGNSGYGSRGGSGDESERDKSVELAVDRRDRVIFHIIMSLGAWYMAMLLTNWAGSADGGRQTANFEASMESVWVKIVSQWLAFLLFCWSVAAPLVCPNREFG